MASDLDCMCDGSGVIWVTDRDPHDGTVWGQRPMICPCSQQPQLQLGLDNLPPPTRWRAVEDVDTKGLT